jgi:hypothetical protein
MKKTDMGNLVYSRYYPIKAYKTCTNDRVWANCLDKPCIVDKNDPTKANCACTTEAKQGNWVIVTDDGATNTCDAGIVSSATVEQVDAITTFLKGQKELQPYDIKVEK